MRFQTVKRFAVPVLAAAMMATAGSAFAEGYGVAQQQGYGYGHEGYEHGDRDRDHDERDAAPEEFREIQRRGFHDGFEGARRDYENHRRPTPENRDEFRHPGVPGYLRDEYRDAFRHGYEEGVHHIYRG